MKNVTLHFPRRCHTDNRRYHNTRSSGGYCTVKLRASRIAGLVQPSLPCQNIYPKNVKWSRYRPGVAQRVGRGIALLFHDRGIRRGWVVSNTPRPHLTPGKYPVLILQEAGWAPGPVWTGIKSRPHRCSIPERLACSKSSHRLSYRAHLFGMVLRVILGHLYSMDEKCTFSKLICPIFNFWISSARFEPEDLFSGRQ